MITRIAPRLIWTAMTLAVAADLPAQAPTADVAAPKTNGAATSVSDATSAALHPLAALTPIDLVLDETVSSDTHQRGDRFPFHVADDVKVDGVTLIPAGSRGVGEVVHAARSRVGGKPGELILAARYVLVDGREIRLRSFAAGYGKDRTNAALAASFAGPAIFLVRGGAFVMPEGTVANAKTAEDALLPARSDREGAARAP